MRQVVVELHKDRPIRGVIHAAMVLRDGIFEQMNHEAFMAAVRPKPNRALRLHKALLDVELDFFVMASSMQF